MNAPERGGAVGVTVLWAGATVVLATLSELPAWALVAAVVAGVSAGVLVRAYAVPAPGPLALVPGLLLLGLLAATTPSAPGPELLGALAAVALLAWYAEAPDRLRGGAARSAPALVLVVLTVGIAWTSALYLPSGTALLGYGAALLAGGLILVAVLVGRPELIDREPPATA